MFVTLLLASAVLAVPRLGRVRWGRRADIDEPQFYLAVHSELRSGASLRQAIAAAALRQDHRVLADIHLVAGSPAPLAAVAAALRPLPNGAAAALATIVAAESGGKAADVFLRLAERARADRDLERTRTTLTTQARLSAAIVGSLPVLWLVFGGVGRLQSLVSAGGAAVAAVGLAMQALGVVLVWRLAAT